MSQAIRNLQPSALWNYFADLNAIPRPSKKEERVIEFAKKFGESLGLPTRVDNVGNVIISKPATPGMENRKAIVMQSHLDMVCQKNSDTTFDFDTQGIEMYVDGDWVKAKGTTLGADNGIGVASIMAILASKDIAHPAIEALFTIDEETGMTGALELQPKQLHGKILLNLDTEEDKELTIGCAGGVDVTGVSSYTAESVPSAHTAYTIAVKGCKGGHSGMDIHLGRANANKLMNRVLYRASAEFGIRVSSIEGGGLRNAIPRESFALVYVANDKIAAFENLIKDLHQTLINEYSSTDPDAVLTCVKGSDTSGVLPLDVQTRLLAAIYACPNGIYRMSPDIQGLVQSSNNLAKVSVKEGNISIQCLTRSAVDSEKMDLADAISSALSIVNAKVTFAGSYPGWTPRPGSDIVKIMADLHQEMFQEKAHVMACHAGLECGIIGRHYPEMDMISFGPNILGAHSPEERVQISSVNKYWGYLLETLKRIPLN
jgi:dipeptidase D